MPHKHLPSKITRFGRNCVKGFWWAGRATPAACRFLRGHVRSSPGHACFTVAMIVATGSLLTASGCQRGSKTAAAKDASGSEEKAPLKGEIHRTNGKAIGKEPPPSQAQSDAAATKADEQGTDDASAFATPAFRPARLGASRSPNTAGSAFGEPDERVDPTDGAQEGDSTRDGFSGPSLDAIAATLPDPDEDPESDDTVADDEDNASPTLRVEPRPASKPTKSIVTRPTSKPGWKTTSASAAIGEATAKSGEAGRDVGRDLGESGVDWSAMKAPARRGVEVQGQLGGKPLRVGRDSPLRGTRSADRDAETTTKSGGPGAEIDPGGTPWGWRNRGEAPPAPSQPQGSLLDDEDLGDDGVNYTPLNTGPGLEGMAGTGTGTGGSRPDALSPDLDPLAQQGHALFPQSLENPADPGLSSWSVVLESFDAQQNAASASAGLDKVRTLAGLPEARLQRRGKVLEIAVGAFDSVDDPKAQAELKRIRELTIGGGTPFAQAVLMGPVAILGGKPEWDLRNAKRQFGKAAKYTLQMGVYTWEPGASDSVVAEARKSAEAAVEKLRGEQEQAFYYHGANSSSVTVGLFSAQDYDPKNPMNQSPTLVELRRKHPYNLQNGKGVRVRDPGKPASDESGWKFVPSVLVNVP